MGLAASQARLLTITARKSDCEFQSMSLSHQKIALSRDMERISDEYHAAMGKTKLVYDFYGTGTSQMNLNYALLMTPSVYNDYFPKFITDKQNRVVLSPKYAAAAYAAGIPHEGYNGVPSSEIRNAFVEALCDGGVITATTAQNIESVPYNNAIGLGSLYDAQSATIDITYEELLNLFKTDTAGLGYYGLAFPLKSFATGDTPDGDPLWLLSRGNEPPVDDGDLERGYNLVAVGAKNGRKVGTPQMDVSLYDLLTDEENNYLLYAESGIGCNLPIGEALFLQKQMVGDGVSPSVLNWLVDQFSAVLGGVEENDRAIQYAYNQVFDLLVPSSSLENQESLLQRAHYATMEENDIEDFTAEHFTRFRQALDDFGTKVGASWNATTADVLQGASNYLGMVYNGNIEEHWHNAGNRKDVAVSVSNVAQVFLTAFKEYLDGLEYSSYSYEKGQKYDSSNFFKAIDGYNRVGESIEDAVLYSPKKTDTFKIAAPANFNDGTEDLVAGFYDAMFNIICTNGWTENSDIENAEYMQELLKNGSVYISSIDNDAYYYQANYSTDTYISEVSDTEAVAQAEAKYNAEKARIEHKENTLDVKMKNLDTEISSLTTEYDTMKNVISKSIEKAFKRYDA